MVFRYKKTAKTYDLNGEISFWRGFSAEKWLNFVDKMQKYVKTYDLNGDRQPGEDPKTMLGRYAGKIFRLKNGLNTYFLKIFNTKRRFM